MIITIDIIMAYIDDNYEPTDTELMLLQDIVRDQKPKVIGRASCKEFDSVSIAEIFDYKVKIDPNRLIKLQDKNRLCLKHNTSRYIYNQF